LVATLLSAAAGGSLLPGAALGRDLPDIGLQLHTVRRLLEHDFEGTLARVATLGYRQVEFAGIYASSIAETRAILERHKLAAPSAHVSFDRLDQDLMATIKAATALGQKFIVCSSIDQGFRRTLDDWKRLCRRLNEIGGQVQRAELGLAYYNHDAEFEPLNGQVPYDVLLAETDPVLVRMELDLYWMAKAGRDPVAYFQGQPDRYPLLHLRDMARDGTVADLGQGTIDFRSILGHSATAGVTCCFVERDDPPDPIGSAETSFRYLQQLDPSP
jgi:sugar phosphate isomerase/epimerase